jgi:hypothetical protein
MSARFLGMLSNGFYVAGLVLLGIAGFLWWTQEDGPGAAVADPERTLSGIRPGEVALVVYLLHNPTRHPVRVCGLSEC